MSNRIDANQPSIVRQLREVGVTVLSLADLGDGAPDILCGFRGKNFAFEIKDWRQPPSKRRLTAKEKLWHQSWRGQVAVVETFEEAYAIIQALIIRETEVKGEANEPRTQSKKLPLA
jgi:hypothetical protein